ncbi:HAD-IIIC family phosphatase [Aetokthonos hydrillicola Thurmond2011]|jgi:FkbH-like protein|uniref:HAD-IIIC family phosphatase n=1 Tax=Aetokthonos hydrillicola Thurmond2011 TaxID=2712845 RepID=A0AAP5MA63_9CYAN|nr:HAD-IIIC family phosphatase [Aetokthonos hydrillicola]MBO3459439.1 HAD-IIIC family phosphatase [Aetokthonos hydrillicola CCALA 1050]MBW4583802.1 HAD-IIIC family phosphatase [Aetokthonos hydrillicola CCALA 1050]MDR9895503.1 HAD-IIIC family phosphatase [Aetokthonos hydrillicola Thurmond2011]
MNITVSQLNKSQTVVQKSIKCVVWDLDNTIWNGTLLEDKCVDLKANIVDIIKTLDRRGILQSIASKNEYNKAINKLEQLGIKEYFIYPMINWNSKVSSIEEIASAINIGLDTVAFVDDQQFELDDVKFSLPQVLCISASDIHQLLDMPEMHPRFITEDSKNRRLMYLSDIKRKKEAEDFVGSKEEFLATLKMHMIISSAKESDLQRAEELTLRTNQLNTTGYTYSYEELNQFRQSENYKLLIASLDDKYGSYGKIGLSLIECQENLWTIKLLLMSCRVMSRGVGGIMLNHIIRMAKEKNVKLRAEFLSNDRNRFMYITYKFSGFQEISKDNDVIVFMYNSEAKPNFPDYVKIEILD